MAKSGINSEVSIYFQLFFFFKNEIHAELDLKQHCVEHLYVST